MKQYNQLKYAVEPARMSPGCLGSKQLWLIIIIVIAIILFSCDHSRQYILTTVKHEGCDYVIIVNRFGKPNGSITHKGNCTNHAKPMGLNPKNVFWSYRLQKFVNYDTIIK